MKNEKDKMFDSVSRALDAMLETIELSRSLGLYDKQLSASAFHLVEVGLKLTQEDSRQNAG